MIIFSWLQKRIQARAIIIIVVSIDFIIMIVISIIFISQANTSQRTPDRTRPGQTGPEQDRARPNQSNPYQTRTD